MKNREQNPKLEKVLSSSYRRKWKLTIAGCIYACWIDIANGKIGWKKKDAILLHHQVQIHDLQLEKLAAFLHLPF